MHGKMLQILPITGHASSALQPARSSRQQPRPRQSRASRHMNVQSSGATCSSINMSQNGASAPAVLELLLREAAAAAQHTPRGQLRRPRQGGTHTQPVQSNGPGHPGPTRTASMSGTRPPQRASTGACPARQRTPAPKPPCTRAAAGAATSCTGHHRQQWRPHSGIPQQQNARIPRHRCIIRGDAAPQITQPIYSRADRRAVQEHMRVVRQRRPPAATGQGIQRRAGLARAANCRPQGPHTLRRAPLD